MADVTDNAFEYVNDAADDPPHLDGDNRGQLMLIAVLAITVLLVDFALTLNTAIYTENLAIHTTDTNLNGAANHGGTAGAGAGAPLDEVSREGGTYDEPASSFDETFDNWSDAATTLAAVRGVVMDVEHISHVRGMRVSQLGTAQNFTDGNETADWTFVSDVDVRGVWLNVSRDSLSTPNASSFHLVVDDEADAVETAVYWDPSRVSMAVEDTGGVEMACSVAADTGDCVTIGITDDRLNGTAYDPLDTIHTDLDGSVTVSHRNVPEAKGSYELYVNETNVMVFDATKYEPAGGGSLPVAQEALYAVTVSYVYESGEVYISRELRIAPGEIA